MAEHYLNRYSCTKEMQVKTRQNLPSVEARSKTFTQVRTAASKFLSWLLQQFVLCCRVVLVNSCVPLM